MLKNNGRVKQIDLGKLLKISISSNKDEVNVMNTVSRKIILCRFQMGFGNIEGYHAAESPGQPMSQAADPAPILRTDRIRPQLKGVATKPRLQPQEFALPGGIEGFDRRVIRHVLR